MSLQDQIEADVDDLLLAGDGDFDTTISITPVGQSAKSIQALIDPVIDEVTKKVIRSKRRIMISSDATLGVATEALLKKAPGVAEGRTFVVDEIDSGADGAWVLMVSVGAPA